MSYREKMIWKLTLQLTHIIKQMTRCCGCGQSEESCLCDDNPFPMYMRGDDWSAKKALFDHQRQYQERQEQPSGYESVHYLKTENDRLKAENEQLKRQLKSHSNQTKK